MKIISNSISIIALILSVFTGTAHPASDAYAMMRTNLYIIHSDGTPILMDGTMTQYDVDFNNDVDGRDARKLPNSSINFGMIRNSTILVIEKRRSIEEKDTIFFKMWGMGNYGYQLDLIAYNLDVPGMTAVLEDQYTGKKTSLSLSDTTKFFFNITGDPASKAGDRFRVVYSRQQLAPMPLKFIYSKALPARKVVMVDWKTSEESNLKMYTIERAGRNGVFQSVGSVLSSMYTENSYRWIDEHPGYGINLYRIVGHDADGQQSQGKVMKVIVSELETGINIHQPVDNANSVTVRINQKESGRFRVSIFSLNGQLLRQMSINYNSGIAIYQIVLPGSGAGQLLVRVTDAQGQGPSRIVTR